MTIHNVVFISSSKALVDIFGGAFGRFTAKETRNVAGSVSHDRCSQITFLRLLTPLALMMRYYSVDMSMHGD
jgi:hypothetical protein